MHSTSWVLNWGSRVYRFAAVSNFLVTVPPIVGYKLLRDLPIPMPNYPFLLWIWSGMAFLWGVVFLEIASNVVEKQAFIKYSYLEKLVTSTSVIVAYFCGNVPAGFMLFVFLTDVIWVPIFIAIHVALIRFLKNSAAEARVLSPGN